MRCTSYDANGDGFKQWGAFQLAPRSAGNFDQLSDVIDTVPPFIPSNVKQGHRYTLRITAIEAVCGYL
jgi:hypothetical protein